MELRAALEIAGRSLGPMGVYLDHAASTPMRPEAIAAMLPFLADEPGNPSGGHTASRAGKTALEEARETVATLCGARPEEVVFTGGGSEGDNLAVKGAAWARRGELDGVVTTGIEHKAVLGAAARLEREGLRVARVPATPGGVVDLDRLSDTVDARTAVVSVMLVNNETGIVQPLDEVAAIVRARAPRAVLHTDAVQAPQWLDLRATTAAAQLVTISGHKFGGPKGVGALIVRAGTPLVPLIEGGGHERDLRAGTQNVAGIVALATALRLTDAQRAEETARIARLRDALEAGLPRERRRLRAERRPRPPGRGGAAWRVHRCRGRDVARRARPARRVCGVRIGVHLGRDRPVARAARDGHVPRTRAVVGALLARVRVEANPTSTTAFASSPRSSRSCGAA